MRSKQNTRRSSSCESGGGAGCWSHTDPAMSSEKKRKEEKATAIFFTEPRCRSGCGELENEIYQRQRVQQVIKLSSLPAKKKEEAETKRPALPFKHFSSNNTHMRRIQHPSRICIGPALYYILTDNPTLWMYRVPPAASAAAVSAD